MVFDIHKTTFYEKKDSTYTHDMEVLVYITFLIQNYNVVFLSFDGNDARIVENNKLLNSIELYKNIPRIFIKKRKKQLVLSSMATGTRCDIIMVDDNKHNIIDINKLGTKSIHTYYYTKNTKYKHQDSVRISNDSHRINKYNSLNKLLELVWLFSPKTDSA